MKGIKFISEFDDSGYGRAARGYLRGLRNAGIPLTWTPMVPGTSWGGWLEPFQGRNVADLELGDLYNRQIEYDTVIVHLPPSYFPRWRSIEKDHKLVGMTVWETPRIPPSWREYFRAVDALLVPSQWNLRAFQEHTSVPVGVAPHLLPEPPSGAGRMEIPNVGKDDFVFYSIGTWSERKGMHLTLESYLRAFTAEDPVVLVLKTGQTDERRRQWGRRWSYVMRHIDTVERDIARIRGRHARPARVALIPDHVSADQIDGLHARGDCYVSLTRGEGWGLGGYEAAGAGNPVVMTRYGGPLQYLPEHLSYLVDFEIIPARPTGAVEREVYGADHIWADPDLDHGSRLMRHIFEHQDEARSRGARLWAHIQENFAADAIIGDMLQFIDSIPARKCA